MSEYFKVMIEDSSCDVDFDVLPDVNTTGDILCNILRFMYTGKSVIDVSNVGLLLRQSILMQLHRLSQQCFEFIVNGLTADNVIQYFKLSVSLHHEPLSMVTSRYIKNNYAQLVSAGSLATLLIEDFQSLLFWISIDGVEKDFKADIIRHWLATHTDCKERGKLLTAIQIDELLFENLECVQRNPAFG